MSGVITLVSQRLGAGRLSGDVKALGHVEIGKLGSLATDARCVTSLFRLPV